MKNEREVAGLRCREVLARLSDYLDMALVAEERARLEAHVAACDHCARFGGVFAATMASLRRRLAHPEPLAEGVRARLAQQLAQG